MKYFFILFTVFQISKLYAMDTVGKNEEINTYQAAKTGDIKRLESWFNKKLNEKDSLFISDGDEALYTAVEYGNVEAVKFLIKMGANLNFQKNITDLTPLMRAVCEINENNEKNKNLENYLEIIQILLDNGADPLLRALNIKHETALDIAKWYEEPNLKVITLLNKYEYPALLKEYGYLTLFKTYGYAALLKRYGYSDQKFIGHDGIKELCEKCLGMRYLYEPEIAVEALKGKTKDDLKGPTIIYEAYEQSDGEQVYSEQVKNKYIADIYVQFISDEIGYGVFANRDIEKDTLINEYTGIIELKSEIEDTTWCWHYPSQLYKEEFQIPDISVDSKYAGNGMRFVNDGDDPNLIMRCIFIDGYFRIIYVSLKDIKKDQQLLISYGPRYWTNRTKKNL